MRVALAKPTSKIYKVKKLTRHHIRVKRSDFQAVIDVDRERGLSIQRSSGPAGKQVHTVTVHISKD